MSFKKKTWSDRVSEYPTRRNLIKADGTSEIVTVERSEGSVSTEGDAFSAENMNNMENRIAQAFGVLLAQDGTEFRFGVNEKGEYGYIVKKDGADTVIPFSNKQRIVAALQHSGLEITADSTWDEIYSKLEERFPEMVCDLLSTWTPDGLRPGSTEETKVSRVEEEIAFKAWFGDGHTAYCETTNIPVDVYQYMRVTGTANCTTGSINHTPTLTISRNGVVLHSDTIPNGGRVNFDIDVSASENLKFSVYGRYQEVTSTFKIYLHN